MADVPVSFNLRILLLNFEINERKVYQIGNRETEPELDDYNKKKLLRSSLDTRLLSSFRNEVIVVSRPAVRND